MEQGRGEPTGAGLQPEPESDLQGISAANPDSSEPPLLVDLGG